MANDYTQWSEMLMFSTDPRTREQEKEWVRSVLKSSDEYEESEPQLSYTIDEHLTRMGIDAKRVETGYWPDFGWKVEVDALWLYSEECGNLDNLAVFVQGFLARFNPRGIFRLEWSSTCSAPRIGAFGGGALVVSSKEIRSMSTYQMASRLVDEIEGK